MSENNFIYINHDYRLFYQKEIVLIRYLFLLRTDTNKYVINQMKITNIHGYPIVTQ